MRNGDRAVSPDANANSPKHVLLAGAVITARAVFPDANANSPNMSCEFCP